MAYKTPLIFLSYYTKRKWVHTTFKQKEVVAVAVAVAKVVEEEEVEVGVMRKSRSCS